MLVLGRGVALASLAQLRIPMTHAVPAAERGDAVTGLSWPQVTGVTQMTTRDLSAQPTPFGGVNGVNKAVYWSGG